MTKKDSILVLCAHSDDQVIGPGGTLAKYAEEGREVHCIVFSFGENSHPWLKKKVTRDMREKESHNAALVLGIKTTKFLGVREGKFEEDIEKLKIKHNIKTLIKKINPSKIFTHSSDDPHPDHSALFRFTNELLEEIKYKKEFFVFDIWTTINKKGTTIPKIVIDITPTFKKKRQALSCFKSQWITMITLGWTVYYKAWINGYKNNCLFAEVFYRIK